MNKVYTLPQFADALERMSNEVRSQAMRDAVMAGAQVVEGYAKVNVMNTFKNVKGNLAGSIQSKFVENTATTATAEVGPTAVYGRIQELGGTIKPIFAKKLHWVDEDGNHHTAMEVTIPARPYLAPALDDHTNDVLEAMGAELKRYIEGAI